MERRKTLNSQSHLEKEEQSWRYHAPGFQHKATLIKTVQYWHKTDTQINGIECMHASVCARLCPMLCDHRDCSLPGSSVCGISQAGVLEWVAVPTPRDRLDPGSDPHLPCHLHSQVDSLSKPPRKPIG